MFIDARIPLRFGAVTDRAPHEAVLTDAPVAPPQPSASFDPAPDASHPLDCACCQPRTAAALALAILFRNRAVAPGPAFTGVLAAVTPPSEAAIRAALDRDPFASARFRLA